MHQKSASKNNILPRVLHALLMTTLAVMGLVAIAYCAPILAPYSISPSTFTWLANILFAHFFYAANRLPSKTPPLLLLPVLMLSLLLVFAPQITLSLSGTTLFWVMLGAGQLYAWHLDNLSRAEKSISILRVGLFLTGDHAKRTDPSPFVLVLLNTTILFALLMLPSWPVMLSGVVASMLAPIITVFALYQLYRIHQKTMGTEDGLIIGQSMRVKVAKLAGFYATGLAAACVFLPQASHLPWLTALTPAALATTPALATLSLLSICMAIKAATDYLQTKRDDHTPKSPAYIVMLKMITTIMLPAGLIALCLLNPAVAVASTSSVWSMMFITYGLYYLHENNIFFQTNEHPLSQALKKVPRRSSWLKQITNKNQRQKIVYIFMFASMFFCSLLAPTLLAGPISLLSTLIGFSSTQGLCFLNLFSLQKLLEHHYRTNRFINKAEKARKTEHARAINVAAILLLTIWPPSSMLLALPVVGLCIMLINHTKLLEKPITNRLKTILASLAACTTHPNFSYSALLTLAALGAHNPHTVIFALFSWVHPFASVAVGFMLASYLLLQPLPDDLSVRNRASRAMLNMTVGACLLCLIQIALPNVAIFLATQPHAVFAFLAVAALITHQNNPTNSLFLKLLQAPWIVFDRFLVQPILKHPIRVTLMFFALATMINPTAVLTLTGIPVATPLILNLTFILASQVFIALAFIPFNQSQNAPATQDNSFFAIVCKALFATSILGIFTVMLLPPPLLMFLSQHLALNLIPIILLTLPLQLTGSQGLAPKGAINLYNHGQHNPEHSHIYDFSPNTINIKKSR